MPMFDLSKNRGALRKNELPGHCCALQRAHSLQTVLRKNRLTGRNHQIPLPGERIPVRISLAPDGRRLAVQVVDKGKWRIELFDLTEKIEPDKPSGSNLLESGEVLTK